MEWFIIVIIFIIIIIKVSAAATCPIDVCKTRIVARDKNKNEKVVTIESEIQIINADNSYNFNNSTASLDYQEDLFDIVPSVSRSISYNNNNNNYDENLLTHHQQSNLIQSNTISSSVVDEKLNINTNYKVNNNNIESTVIDDKNSNNSNNPNKNNDNNNNVLVEMIKIFKEEGVGTLFLGFQQRLVYVGLANGIRLAAYGTSRMNLMMSELEEL